uniref:Ig-like domain-containing protein n=1 Tax=Gouania willdenowi TaxID=441366 RepID=A0A8C5DTY0_GOUWI
MINEFGYCSLDYEVAYARDSGVITCRATNKFGVDQTSATLIVKDEKGLVEETQLPEGRVHRIDELERMAHEGGPYGVTAEEETEKQKPLIVLLPEPTRVLEGDIARFRCRVTGYPAPKVNWYLNGQLIRKSKRYRLRYDGIYYMEITEIKSYDAGEVKVVADNNLGSTEHIVKLEIQQKEDFRTHLRRAPETRPAEAAPEPGKVAFEVVKEEKSEGYYESITAVELKSRKRDESYEDLLKKTKEELLHRAKEKEEAEKKKKEKELNVTAKPLKPERVKLSASMEAVFTLELTHEDVKGAQWIKNGVEIQPSDKYEITMEGTTHTLKINNCTNARLNISEDNIPVKWMFKNKEVSPSEHYRMISEKKTHKLIVQDVDNSKEGNYTVVVGHLQCSACLMVECEYPKQFRTNHLVSLSSALRVTKPLKNVIVPETQTASFECEVSHFNVPSMWLKDGVEIEMSEKFRIVVQGKLHQLKITNTSKDDSAEYTFVCGNDRVSATLTVSRKTTFKVSGTQREPDHFHL